MEGSERLWELVSEGVGRSGGSSVVGRGSVTEMFRSAGCWAPRERIRPKDARRECARDLTDAAMVFGLESTLSMVGRAVRGWCSQSRGSIAVVAVD